MTKSAMCIVSLTVLEYVGLTTDSIGKIQRENDMIEASMRMRQGTTNVSVHQALDSKIREGQKNISYLSDSLKKLQVSQSTQTSGAPRRGSRDDPTDVFDQAYTTLPTPRPNYTQQPGPGIPKPRNQTKLGIFVVRRIRSQG